MRECFSLLAEDADCRAVVLSGAGKIYTAGMEQNRSHHLLHVTVKEMKFAPTAISATIPC